MWRKPLVAGKLWVMMVAFPMQMPWNQRTTICRTLDSDVKAWQVRLQHFEYKLKQNSILLMFWLHVLSAQADVNYSVYIWNWALYSWHQAQMKDLCSTRKKQYTSAWTYYMVSYDYEKYFELSIKAYSYLAAVADLPVSGGIQGWELFTNLSGQIFHRVSTLQEVGPATRKRWRKRPRFNKCKACIVALGDSGAGLKPGGSGFISSSFHHLGWVKMFQEKAALLPGRHTFSIMMHQHSEQVWTLT